MTTPEVTNTLHNQIEQLVLAALQSKLDGYGESLQQHCEASFKKATDDSKEVLLLSLS